MTRVASYKTRQALLSVGVALDPSTTEKLELFTDDGVPVDVGKDRTRARWRGTWSADVVDPYETNDFVMDNDKLWILQDQTIVDDLRPSESDAGAWILMTVSGMQFFGEWAPGGYKKQSVVTRDNKLWISNVDIVDAEFEFVASAWDDQYGGTDTISIPVPAGTVVGDIMIWAGQQSHYAKRSRPSDYIDWELLSSDGINADAFPPGHTELYAKVVTVDDLGTNKVCTENPGENGTVQLLVFRASGMPTAAEVDLQKFQVDSLPTALTATPGADPAETQPEDKVLRIFIAQAQNFAIDSGLLPAFSASSDSQDELIFDKHQLFGGGSYWADAGAASLSSFVWTSGEHKYAIRYVVRLPSPTGFNPDQWDLIGLLEGGGDPVYPALVDTLPGAPVDGMEVYFQNAAMEAQGILWHLRYRAASSSPYKWEPVGGAAAIQLYDATQYNTTNAAFTAAGAATITAPLDGEYVGHMSAALGLDNAGANKYSYMGVAVDGVVDAGASMRRAGSATEAYGVDGRSLTTKVLDVDAGDLIRPMFKQEGTVLAYIEQIKLSVIPIRVG